MNFPFVLVRQPHRLLTGPLISGGKPAARLRVFSIREQRASADDEEMALVSLVMVKAVITAAQDYAPEAHIPALPGIDLSAIVDPSLGIARAELGKLLESIGSELRDDAIGLTLGKSVGSSHFHVAGPLIMNSVTARQALHSFLTLRRSMLGGPAWQLRIAQGEAKIGHPLADFRGARAEAEFGIAVAYKAALRFWGGAARSSLRVEFSFRQPADMSRYDALFGARVTFDAEQSCLVFPEAFLDRVRPGGDPKLAASLADFTLDRYLQDQQADWWTRAVRLALVSARSLRALDVESVGAQFQLSARTLRRRLEREGSNFRKLLEGVRLERARELLETTTDDIETIAVALGYEEVNAFRRAFKAWSGSSPSAFRDGGADRPRSDASAKH